MYSDATRLTRELEQRGLVVECVRRSKEERLFEGQKGAAWFQTDKGVFEVWFLPESQSFRGLEVIGQEPRRGRFVYTFGGTPHIAMTMDSAKPISFIEHGNALFEVVGNAALADTLRQALKNTVQAALQVDATPPGIVASPQYTVRLNQDAGWLSSFVYQVQNPGFLPNGQPSGISSSSTLEHSTAWTSFSFAGPPVLVEVTNSAPFTSARVLPSHRGVIPIVRGNSVFFLVDRPGQLAVDFCATGATCTESNDTM